MHKYVDKTTLRDKAKEIQQQRYDLCNSKGHQELNAREDYCYYCDRNYPQTIQQKHPDKINGLINILDALSK